MNVHSYLERIGYDKPARCDAQSLFSLHRTHLLSVPFENLDIHAGVQIQLSEQALWDKIVTRRRGGFCYELNGLFAWLLQQTGFEVAYLNGRVYNSEGKRGHEFDHLALLVKIPGAEQAWVADVGFGDSFFEPLQFEPNKDQAQGLRAFRMQPVAYGYDLIRRDFDGEWRRQYFFDLQPRDFPVDYEAGCLYHQSSPRSSFTRGRVVSLATPEGRITLDRNYLTVTTEGKRIKRKINSEDEFRALLNAHFGIAI